MRKSKIIVSIILVLFLLLLCIQAKSETLAGSNIFEKWGNYLSGKSNTKSRQATESESGIYAKGNSAAISIKEMEQTVYFFKLQGNDDEVAEAAAYEYMKESAALYAEAVKNGYAVTSTEVEDYVEELKAISEDSSLDETSKNQIQDVIAGFGNEEDYWEYQKQVYQKLLVSQKYVDTLQKDFYNNSSASTEDWSQYFQSFKDSLVKEQDFQIIGTID